MKSYVKVRDVLNKVRLYHEAMETLYNQRADQAEQDRVALLFRQMGRHEHFFADKLQQIVQEEAKRLLDTWIQYGPDEDKLQPPSPGDIRPDAAVDEIARFSTRSDDMLVDFFSNTVRRANAPAARLFENLAERYRKDKAKRAKDAFDVETGI